MIFVSKSLASLPSRVANSPVGPFEISCNRDEIHLLVIPTILSVRPEDLVGSNFRQHSSIISNIQVSIAHHPRRLLEVEEGGIELDTSVSMSGAEIAGVD